MRGVDDPVLPDAVEGVQFPLVVSVHPRRRRRQYLDDHVRSSLHVVGRDDVFPVPGDEEQVGLYDVEVSEQDVEWAG